MKKLLWILFILAGCTDARKIIDNPINFDQERIDLTLAYLSERYGLDQSEPVIDPKVIVIHHTVIPTLEGTIKAFMSPTLPSSRAQIAGAGTLNVSSQFVVDRDGTIYRLMPETYMARHTIGLNHCAIGVENVGGTPDTPLTEEQLESNVWLVRYLKKKYNIDFVIGHHEYTLFEDHELWLEKDDGYRTKKNDPGEEFMKSLREQIVDLDLTPVPGNEDPSMDRILFDAFDKFREQSLNIQRIKHKNLQPLITKFQSMDGFDVTKVGESIDGRDLSLISTGSGETDIFLWSQMHGNEPTATMAIFDILNFLADPTFLLDEKKEVLSKVRIHFLPMLNPDGAERFVRRNSLHIDINRDALRLQTPEGRTLKKVRDSLDAEFGFNLHDQSRYYNAVRTSKPATLSYLAPAYNYEKEVNDVRANAMKVIIHMNRIIQKYAPGQVGRYNDDFEPRAFGDNIQKWGTSAVLIESGGHYNDPEKQFIRKLNYMSILSAIFTIADGSFTTLPLEEYATIPENDRKLFDLKIENLNYRLADQDFIIDLGIVRDHINNDQANSFHYRGSVVEVGDMSTYYGYETLDATELHLEMGKVYNGAALTYDQLTSLDWNTLLDQGFTDLQLSDIPNTVTYSKYPINLTVSKEVIPEDLELGMNASFLLKNGDILKYVVINGFLYEPEADSIAVINGIIR